MRIEKINLANPDNKATDFDKFFELEQFLMVDIKPRKVKGYTIDQSKPAENENDFGAIVKREYDKQLNGKGSKTHFVKWLHGYFQSLLTDYKNATDLSNQEPELINKAEQFLSFLNSYNPATNTQKRWIAPEPSQAILNAYQSIWRDYEKDKSQIDQFTEYVISKLESGEINRNHLIYIARALMIKPTKGIKPIRKDEKPIIKPTETNYKYYMALFNRFGIGLKTTDKSKKNDLFKQQESQFSNFIDNTNALKKAQPPEQNIIEKVTTILTSP